MKTLIVLLLAAHTAAYTQSSDNPNPGNGDNAIVYSKPHDGECEVSSVRICWCWDTWPAGNNKKWVKVDCPPCLHHCFDIIDNKSIRTDCKCYRLVDVIPAFDPLPKRPMRVFRRGA